MNTLQAIAGNLRRVIKGKDDVIDQVLIALAANGHVLIEDVPGVGKTTLGKALARSLRGEFHRLQFTPDLLPTDIDGGMVYSAATGEFTFHPGPIFGNIVLADEINRASPRTQSALLEAMDERQVTVEGHAHPLPKPFMVIGTENPIEYHGTYPLPESQLDRFAMKLQIGYPDEEREMEIVEDQRERHPLDDLDAVVDTDDILRVRREVRTVAVEKTVVKYITGLVRSTRHDPHCRLGASPRAALVLYRTSQARAYLRQRDYVTPDDVKALAISVLAHRLVLNTKAQYAGVSKGTLVRERLSAVKVPV